MKITIFSCVFLLISFLNFAQQSNESQLESIIKFQHDLNEEYKDPEESPLSEDERLSFTQHDFYEIAFFAFNEKYTKSRSKKALILM